MHKLTSSIQTLKDEIEHDKQTLEPLIVRLFDSINNLSMFLLLERDRNQNQRKKSNINGERKNTFSTE